MEKQHIFKLLPLQKIMNKPIIATTLSGLFIKQEPWDKAHLLWFEKMAKQLKDNSVKDWANKRDYFKGVDEIMKRAYPSLSEEQRTEKARELFFDAVCDYVKQNPRVINQPVVKYFLSLKGKYSLALITTNTKSALERILSLTELDRLFDITETSNPQEKDDKRIVFERFIKKYGKPVIYIGGGRKDSYDYCKEKNIPVIFANLDNQEPIEDVETIKTFRELKKRIEII